MSDNQFENEIMYMLSKEILKRMFLRKLITEEEYEKYENKIDELIKQSNTLNQLMQKRCIDSAFYIQQKNMTEKKIIELKR